jgi:hypothetical protein
MTYYGNAKNRVLFAYGFKKKSIEETQSIKPIYCYTRKKTTN